MSKTQPWVSAFLKELKNFKPEPYLQDFQVFPVNFVQKFKPLQPPAYTAIICRKYDQGWAQINRKKSC